MPQHHFITGLPESGSRVLVALLNQQANTLATLDSPIRKLCVNALASANLSDVYSRSLSGQQIRQVLLGTFSAYYGTGTATMILDHNYLWGTWTHYLDDMFPGCKFVVCVRDVAAILNSIEQQVRSPEYNWSKIFTAAEHETVYTRSQALLRPDHVVGASYTALKQLVFSGYQNRILFLDWDKFRANPAINLASVCQFLGIEYTSVDFNAITLESSELDHTAFTEQHSEIILPTDITGMTQGMEFWKFEQPTAA